MPAAAGTENALVTPGHHVDRHTGRAAGGDLLAAPAEHERVAALEPHHPATGLRVLDEQPVDLVLRHRMSAGRLADVQDQHAGRRVRPAPTAAPAGRRPPRRPPPVPGVRAGSAGRHHPGRRRPAPPGPGPGRCRRSGSDPESMRLRDGVAHRDRASRIRRNAGAATEPTLITRSSRRTTAGVRADPAAASSARTQKIRCAVACRRPLVGDPVPGGRERPARHRPDRRRDSRARCQVSSPAAASRDDLLAGVGRHHQHVGAGRQAGRDLARRHRSPADHQHAAAGQGQVQRQHLVGPPAGALRWPSRGQTPSSLRGDSRM